MKDCLFCKIIENELPSDKLYEDDSIIVIKDIAPQAKCHVLVIPKKHFECLDDVASLQDDKTLLELIKGASKAANLLGLKTEGYRLVINTGIFACQSIKHLHIHILGGNQLIGRMG